MQTCIWPSRCHCHSLSLASVKSRLVLPFWYRLTRVVPQKGPLNGCVCVCVCDDLTPENALCLDVYCDAYLTCCLCYTLAKYKQIGVKYTPCSNKKNNAIFRSLPGYPFLLQRSNESRLRTSQHHSQTNVREIPPSQAGRGRGSRKDGTSRTGYHTPIRDLDRKKTKPLRDVTDGTSEQPRKQQTTRCKQAALHAKVRSLVWPLGLLAPRNDTAFHIPTSKQLTKICHYPRPYHPDK